MSSPPMNRTTQVTQAAYAEHRRLSLLNLQDATSHGLMSLGRCCRRKAIVGGVHLRVIKR